MSIRLRLTLLYSGILALTLITFSTVLYVIQRHSTYDSIKTDLVHQAAILTHSDGNQPGPPPGGAPPGGAPGTSESGDTLPGRWAQVLNLDGIVMQQTPDLSGTSLPLSAKELAAVQAGINWFETAQLDGEPLLIYSRPYQGASGVTQIVQVAFPINQPQQSMNNLRIFLMAGSSLVFVAALATGWVLAGAALRPIHRITSTAQTIGAERNFSRRVEHKGPTDEVGQLAITFNEMLAELESGYRQLESALGSQRRFAADASHELRTPLTTVRGNIELLRREQADHVERAEILADTTAEVDRLIRLVNQLLVLARADAGQALRREPVALKPLVEDVCKQAKLITPNNAIRYEAPADDITVLGDGDALKQVLLILVDNAHVHTPPETVIAISAKAVDGGASISVRDTGPGIAPDVLPHIFERFYRGGTSRTGRGAGLGLAIAKELVEMQGGTIAVESELGKGSTFTVTMRRA